MGTNYPAGLDDFTNPIESDKHATPGVEHWIQHANANDAIEAIEAELGVTPSGAYADVGAAIAAALAGGGAGVEDVNVVAASGSTETLPDTDDYQINSVTVTADLTLTFPSASAGKYFTLMLMQDTTGDWDVTWPSNVVWPDGIVHTLTQGIGVSDLFRFVCIDGSNWVGSVLAERLSLVSPPRVRQYVVGGASGGNTVTTTGSSVFNSTPVAGNLILAFLHSVGTREGTPSTPVSGWTERYDTATTDGTSLQCWTRTVGGAESNSYQVDWTDTAEYNSAIFVEVENWTEIDEALSSVVGKTAPSGTSTDHPNLILVHYGTDGGTVTLPSQRFNDDNYTEVLDHKPNYHTNGVGYYLSYNLTWPSAMLLGIGSTNIPRGLISVSNTV